MTTICVLTFFFSYYCYSVVLVVVEVVVVIVASCCCCCFLTMMYFNCQVITNISDVAAECFQVKIQQLVQFDKLKHLVEEMLAWGATTLATCILRNCIIFFAF